MLSSFSEIVVRELLRPENRSETVLACREWREMYPNDPDRAAVEFAGQLDHDFKEMYGGIEGCAFVGEMMAHALRHVNWRRVADYLLDRFCPPPETQQVVFHALRITSPN